MGEKAGTVERNGVKVRKTGKMEDLDIVWYILAR